MAQSQAGIAVGFALLSGTSLLMAAGLSACSPNDAGLGRSTSVEVASPGGRDAGLDGGNAAMDVMAMADFSLPRDAGQDTAPPAPKPAPKPGPNPSGTDAAAPAVDGRPDARSDAGAIATGTIPAKLPTPAGACPEFVSGEVTFNPVGGPRTVNITIGPAAETKSGPLVFYWHATNSDVDEAEKGLPLAQVTAVGGIVVAPQDVRAAGPFPWLSNFARHNALFDEVVACALKKTKIDPRRIHALGFSAGALMTTQLGFARADLLASVATYSGGSSASFPMPEHNKFAAMIMAGGASDIVFINFLNTSLEWRTTLKQAGHFTIFCNHGRGHNIPRALVPGVWQFFLDHPYGVMTSPYAGNLPDSIQPPCVE